MRMRHGCHATISLDAWNSADHTRGVNVLQTPDSQLPKQASRPSRQAVPRIPRQSGPDRSRFPRFLAATRAELAQRRASLAERRRLAAELADYATPAARNDLNALLDTY